MAKLTTAEKIENFLGMVLAIAILAGIFNYDLKWITGKDVPFALDFFATAVFIRVHRKTTLLVYWITFVVCLLLMYSGATTPFLH